MSRTTAERSCILPLTRPAISAIRVACLRKTSPNERGYPPSPFGARPFSGDIRGNTKDFSHIWISAWLSAVIRQKSRYLRLVPNVSCTCSVFRPRPFSLYDAIWHKRALGRSFRQGRFPPLVSYGVSQNQHTFIKNQ